MRKSTFARIGWMTLPLSLLGGCGVQGIPLLDPKGPIGLAERHLIIEAFLLMLIPVIPVLIMTFWFARRYRASNPRALYAPRWAHSARIEAVVWIVPALIVLSLGVLIWSSTHALSPEKPLASTHAPLRVEAIATDWKWLFIYPDLHLATVNELVFPANVPVEFRITSDTVMTCFFIPRLGSQIYAMAGMQTPLHLMASKPGTYQGLNSQFSGRGFAAMHFKAIATSRSGFDAWVATVRAAPRKLDAATYRKLESPSIGNEVTHFSSVEPNLFDAVIDKYRPGEMRRDVVAGAMEKQTR